MYVKTIELLHFQGNLYKMVMPEENVITKFFACIWVSKYQSKLAQDIQIFSLVILFFFYPFSIRSKNQEVRQNRKEKTCLIMELKNMAKISLKMSGLF